MEPDCSDVALLLGAVLQEGVHQLGVDEVAGVEAVEDVVAAVVRDAAQDGEAGHQHRVVVVAERAVLDEADQRVEAAQGEQLSAHRGVRAESEEIFRLEMLRQNNMIIIVMNNGLQNAGPTAILSLIVLQTKAIRRFVITEKAPTRAMLSNLSVLYDFCFGDPISHLLTVGSTPV